MGMVATTISTATAMVAFAWRITKRQGPS